MTVTAFYDVPAPAKLNLFLHLVGRRADGYHLLQSVFALIDWCDTLHFERRADGRLQRQDLGASLPDDDLCLRAARLLQQHSGTGWGADIAIEKRIPWGAGLGGGSSDAATTLLALNRLWGLHWPRGRLLSLAALLGADVPFFVGGHNAWVEGIGEQLVPIDIEPRWWAVLKPAVSVPTAAVFAHPGLVRDNAPATLADYFADPTGFGRNDLQACAQAVSSGTQDGGASTDGADNSAPASEIGQALALLQARYGASRMSGSGSAVFAEAGTGKAPKTASMDAATLPAGWVTRMCRGLAQHPLVHWVEDNESQDACAALDGVRSSK